MSVVRFSVSLEQKLVEKFDRMIQQSHLPNRSKAIADLIRNALVEFEWRTGHEVAGAIVIVYDHHKRNIVTKLIAIQHNYHEIILSTQHIHLDHDNCLEIIAVRGKPLGLDNFIKELKSIKGLKHLSLAIGTTGKTLP
jgi:CopG family nickel-responsive transcriptional regulator